MKSLPEQPITTSKGYIFDFKRFATHDGQGIRTTVFLKGCPLHCAWCQNPEGLSPKPEIMYMPNNCIHCLCCVHASKHKGVTFTGHRICVDRSQPEDWHAIVDACPTTAMRFDAKQYTVDQAMKEVRKDKAFFKYGGGLTISGGEPFMQAKKVVKLLSMIDKRLTVMVYSGFKYEELLKYATNENGYIDLLKMTDVLMDGKFIMDLKDENLDFRGSSNQRAIEAKNSLASGYVIEHEF